MEGSCEYTEKAVAVSRQGMFLHIGGWSKGTLLRNFPHGFGFGTKFCSENWKGRDHSENPDTDGVIILERILRKYGGKVWTEYMWLRIGTKWFTLVNTVINFRVS
jgi:hypothetical protein